MRPGGVAYDSADARDRPSCRAGDGHRHARRPGERDPQLQEVTGGFGTVIGFAHDWANREATLRSWELVARYVVPEVNGMLDAYRESQRYVIEHREAFERGATAIMAKINENERAAKALAEMGRRSRRQRFRVTTRRTSSGGGAGSGSGFPGESGQLSVVGEQA